MDKSASAAATKSLDYYMGADFGTFKIPNAVVVTEIETCPYACIFAEKKVEDLPSWLTD